MADQGRWFKLWGTALDDPDLDNLSHELWACWAKFGIFTKIHGERGTIRLQPPARALQSIFRVRSFEDVLLTVLKLPNVLVATGPIRWPHGHGKRPVLERGSWVRLAGVAGRVLLVSEEGGTGVQATIGGLTEVWVSWRNWVKYQEDYSTPRQKRRRGGNGVATGYLSRSKKRREEKRTPPYPPTGGLPPPAPEDPSTALRTFRLHAGMFNDCRDGKAGMCVRSEYLDQVPTPVQCAEHRTTVREA